uniref:Uncharacterized protein n=1 Tax=Parascaris equorum TaxID=6256 RepID=A0A914S020_PAREQ
MLRDNRRYRVHTQSLFDPSNVAATKLPLETDIFGAGSLLFSVANVIAPKGDTVRHPIIYPFCLRFLMAALQRTAPLKKSEAAVYYEEKINCTPMLYSIGNLGKRLYGSIKEVQWDDGKSEHFRVWKRRDDTLE